MKTPTGWSIQNWGDFYPQVDSLRKSDTAQITTGSDGVLAIHLAATQPDTFELLHTQPASLTSDFAIDFKLKLAQVGRDDNSTGYKSNFQLEFLTGAPLNLRIKILLTHDRYKIGDQYKIYRTDENWHDWHWEIRPAQNMIFMYRDGIYECAHQIAPVSEAPNSSLKIFACSDPELTTQIELGPLTIRPIVPESKAQPVSQRLVHTIQPGEWPMFRRDRQNTGFSPLKGKMKNPKIQWAYSLGGAFGNLFFDDIDGDGQNEVLITITGRLRAYRLDGTPMWDVPLENVYIYGMHDLDGDGVRELVLGAGFIQNVHVLDGKTGKVRYKCPYDPTYNVEGVKIAPINPALRGQQLVICNRNEIGYCLSFENGIENGRVAWTYDYKMRYFTPEFVLVDMDRDGVLEMVAATYRHFFVYSGIDGSVKMHLEIDTGRNYGMLVARDLDDDGFPDLIMFADQLREHIAVIKNEGGKSLKLLWDKFYEQNYPIDQKELRVFDDAVADFDGDSRLEIIYGLWDETRQTNWHTLVVDALTGETKYDLPGSYPVNAIQFWEDAPPQLLLSHPTNRTTLNLTNLDVVSLHQARPDTLAQLDQRQLLTQPSFREAPLHIMKKWSSSLSPLPSPEFKNGAYFYRLDNNGKIIAIDFLQLNSNREIQTRWSLEKPFQTQTDASFVCFQPEISACIFNRPDNHYYLVAENGQSLARFACGGQICSPLAGKLSSDNELRILVDTPFGKLRCLKPQPGAQPPTQDWEYPQMASQLGWGSQQGHRMPIILDLDRDGEPEIIVGEDPGRLVLLNPHGQIKNALPVARAPQNVTFGQFSGDAEWELFLSFTTGNYQTSSQVLKVQQPTEPVWEINCGNGPPTVFDLNGDGREEIILRDLFERRSLDGRTGRDQFPITQWCGYHMPIVAQPMQGEPFIIWTGGVYSVLAEKLNHEQMWWRPFFAYRFPCGLGDVDGDGKLEIGGATLGQLYNWPDVYPVDGPDHKFVCLNAHTGETKWEFPVNGSISGAITADVDGDGKPEFIFGTTDGHLFALRGGKPARRVAFDIQLPAALGAPIVCDLLGTGKMQILVGCADGKLYCIQ